MARLDYSGIQEQDQEQQIGNLPGQTGGGVPGAAGGFSRPSTGGAAIGGATQGPGPVSAPQGSKFTNVQQYLQANQGTGQAMASQVGQTVDKSITRTGGNISKANEELAKLNQAEQDRLARAERAGEVIQEDPTQIGGVTAGQTQPVPEAPDQVQIQPAGPIIPEDQTPQDDYLFQLFGTDEVMPPANEVFSPEEIAAFKNSGQAPPGYAFGPGGNLMNLEQYSIWSQGYYEPRTVPENYGVEPSPEPVEDIEPEFTIDDIGRYRAGLAGSDYDLIAGRAMEQVDQINPELARALTQASDTATEQGRYNLLRESLGRPGYTSGEQRLDQLLVQSEGQGTLRNLKKEAAERAAGLMSQYEQYREGTAEQQEALREAILGAQGTINRAIGNWSAEDEEGALGRLYNELAERASTLPEELQTQYREDVQQWLTDPSSLTAEQLERLGLADPNMVYAGGPPPGTLAADYNLYGLQAYLDDDGVLRRHVPDGDDEELLFTNRPDLSGFTQEALMGNVATDADRARLSALRQIADLSDTEAYLGEGAELPDYALDREAVEFAAQQQRDRVLSDYSKKIGPEYVGLHTGNVTPEDIKMARLFAGNQQDVVDFLNASSGNVGGWGKYEFNPQTGKLHVNWTDGWNYSMPVDDFNPEKYGSGKNAGRHYGILSPWLEGAKKLFPEYF